MKRSDAPPVTTDDLLFYLRCARRVYLDAHGDSRRRDRPGGFVEKLRADALEYRAEILKRFDITAIASSPHDWRTGAEETLHHMAEGAAAISGGVLVSEAADGRPLVGYPHVLVREEGVSCFGDWQYTPIDIRLGKKPKQEYQIVAAFHAELLSMVQCMWSDRAEIVLRSPPRPHRVDLEYRVPQMQKVLGRLLATLDRPEPPPYFISRSRCSLCPWLNDCRDRARSDRHLCLLPGVTLNRYRILEKLGLTTVEALADADPERLAPFPEFGNGVIPQIQAQARAHRDAQPVPRAAHPHFTGDRFPSAPIELYFDIEAEPERGVDFLFGVLVVDREADRTTFHPCLAESPDQEAEAWAEFLALVESYGDAPIFHFCEYEVETIQRLGEQFGVDRDRLQRIVTRCVDIHAWTVKTVVLPVEGYALKQIAGYLGFQWRDPTADGGQAVYWYDRWLRLGDRAALDAIAVYNEDDCRATWAIKDWLAGFLA